MIIAAYAGTGKSYAAQHMEGALDMAIVPYKYKFPEGYGHEIYSEKDKANTEYPLNWDYPYDYVQDLIEHMKNYKHILIPSDYRVMKILETLDIDYILCYPDRNDKDIYLQRYTERGNSESFMDIFIGKWDSWMDSFERMQCKKRVLKSNEYILDILKELDFEN